MRIKELLQNRRPRPMSLDCRKSVANAARTLMANYVGALIVNDEHGRLLGVLSERDIAVAVALYPAKLEEVTVNDVMTGKVITCSPDDTVAEVADIMLHNDIRHVAVLDGDDVSDLVSMRDVLRSLAATEGHAAA